MKVRFTRSGTTADLADEKARLMIASGRAVAAETPKVEPKSEHVIDVTRMDSAPVVVDEAHTSSDESPWQSVSEIKVPMRLTFNIREPKKPLVAVVVPDAEPPAVTTNNDSWQYRCRNSACTHHCTGTPPENAG